MPWKINKKIKNLFRQKTSALSPTKASAHAPFPIKKGSITIEAAIVVPLFFLATVALICVMDLQRIKSEINVSLNQSAKELGMYAFALNGAKEESPVGAVDDAVCMIVTMNRIKDNEQVSLLPLKTTYQDNRIELWISGHYKLPVSILPLPKIVFQNRVNVHDWTGYSGDFGGGGASDIGGEMVYVTDYQSVYHTSSKCTHLELSIVQTTKNQVAYERNENGAKYYDCPHCVNGNEHLGTVYITKTGDRYHADLNCQSLKRSVRLVEKDLLSGISECSRCREMGGADEH